MGYNLQASPSASSGELREWSSTYRWILIVGGLFTFVLAFMAGTNDVPASFGTSFGSGALTLSQSAAFSFLMEVLGATIMGNPIVDILQSDILKERPTAPLLMWGFMIAIIVATIWLEIATYLKIHGSSFLSIKGAIIGISITTEGLHSIYWKKFDSSSVLKVGGVVSIVLSWIIAPLIAGVATFILFSFTRLVLLRSKAARQRVLCALPFYYGSTVMVLVLFFIYRVMQHCNLFYNIVT
jgi:sodium-dependent phosphate transporter